MEKSAVYYERGEKIAVNRGVFMEYRMDLEKNATDRVFLRKCFSWVLVTL